MTIICATKRGMGEFYLQRCSEGVELLLLCLRGPPLLPQSIPIVTSSWRLDSVCLSLDKFFTNYQTICCLGWWCNRHFCICALYQLFVHSRTELILYRTEIRFLIETVDLVTHWFVRVQVMRLYSLPEEMKTPLPAVVDCYLCNLMPKDLDMLWSSTLTQWLKEKVDATTRDCSSQAYIVGNVRLFVNTT